MKKNTKLKAGRPKEADPKETFDVRLRTSQIERVGRVKLRAKIQDFVDSL